MSRFRLTFEAETDLLEIETYILQNDSVRAARRVLQELEEGMSKVADMPGIGHVHSEVHDKELRVWVVHSWLILYDPRPNPVVILRVLDGRRDVGQLL